MCKEGDYKENENGKIVRSGHGKFVSLANQSTYEGEWVNDEISGKGILKKKNEIKNIIFEYELRKKIFQQIVN